MTLQEIIESGLIELYAMNALSVAETAQVEAWAMQFPEIKAEIDAAQTALELYAQAHAIEPSADMKAKIMTAFEADVNNKSKSEREESLENSKNTPLSIKSEKAVLDVSFVKILPWLIAATALMLAMVGFWKAKNVQNKLANCQLESTQLAKKQEIIVDLERKMDILRSPKTKPFDMKTPEKSSLPKDLKVMVYWNPEAKATLLSIQKLPDPGKGKQYQLWAIVGTNAPVDAGLITYDLTAVQQMKVFEKVDVFAITLEKEGGSDVPTLDKMYVLGTMPL